MRWILLAIAIALLPLLFIHTQTSRSLWVVSNGSITQYTYSGTTWVPGTSYPFPDVVGFRLCNGHYFYVTYDVNARLCSRTSLDSPAICVPLNIDTVHFQTSVDFLCDYNGYVGMLLSRSNTVAFYQLSPDLSRVRLSSYTFTPRQQNPTTYVYCGAHDCNIAYTGSPLGGGGALFQLVHFSPPSTYTKVFSCYTSWGTYYALSSYYSPLTPNFVYGCVESYPSLQCVQVRTDNPGGYCTNYKIILGKNIGKYGGGASVYYIGNIDTDSNLEVVMWFQYSSDTQPVALSRDGTGGYFTGALTEVSFPIGFVVPPDHIPPLIPTSLTLEVRS